MRWACTNESRDVAPAADSPAVAALNGIAAATDQTMTSPNVRNSNRRSRGLSISFERPEAQWVDGLVALLRDGGYPSAKRSEVVRIAVLALQDAMAGRGRADIVKYFVERDAARRVAAVTGSTPKLPSD